MSNFGRWRPRIATLLLGAALIGLASGCSVIRHGPEAGPPPPVAPDSPPPPLPVDKAPEDVIVAAWAEPSRLPPAGGEAQILVRRLRTSAGSLYSGGKVLVTDSSGRTRDRLTTHSSAHITLNAGGTVYRFHVPVAVPSS